MMVTLTSLDELKTTFLALEKLKKDYPALFEKVLDLVNLTRAFHFKYQYMVTLLMNEDPGDETPNFVADSVLRLYKREMRKLKEDEHFRVFKQFCHDYKGTGYTKICLLVLGKPPESLVGSIYVK